jgi:hypothetical protein
LDVVIVVLRVVLCGELALAITAAWLRTFPAEFSVEEYVGVASENARRVNITLARRFVNDGWSEPPTVFDPHAARVFQ